MKIINYLVTSLVVLTMCGCQKNEVVDSEIENNLPQVLSELQQEYGVKITESISSAGGAEILSLDEIKKRLDFFKVLCQDTVKFKKELADQNTSLEASMRSLPYGDLTYYSTEYITTPEVNGAPESYIKVNVALTTQFYRMRFTLQLTEANSTHIWLTDLVRNNLKYNSYSGGFDLEGAIRISYSYQSLETGTYYNITGRYDIDGSIDVSRYEMVFINFKYTDPW